MVVSQVWLWFRLWLFCFVCRAYRIVFVAFFNETVRRKWRRKWSTVGEERTRISFRVGISERVCCFCYLLWVAGAVVGLSLHSPCFGWSSPLTVDAYIRSSLPNFVICYTDFTMLTGCLLSIVLLHYFRQFRLRRSIYAKLYHLS